MTLTLEQAIAELRRVMPVYDAACRHVDALVFAGSGDASNELVRRVRIARPHFPAPPDRLHPDTPAAE